MKKVFLPFLLMGFPLICSSQNIQSSDQSDFDFYSNCGYTLFESKCYEAARKAYLVALEIAPLDSNYHRLIETNSINVPNSQLDRICVELSKLDSRYDHLERNDRIFKLCEILLKYRPKKIPFILANLNCEGNCDLKKLLFLGLEHEANMYNGSGRVKNVYLEQVYNTNPDFYRSFCDTLFNSEVKEYAQLLAECAKELEPDNYSNYIKSAEVYDEGGFYWNFTPEMNIDEVLKRDSLNLEAIGKKLDFKCLSKKCDTDAFRENYNSLKNILDLMYRHKELFEDSLLATCHWCIANEIKWSNIGDVNGYENNLKKVLEIMPTWVGVRSEYAEYLYLSKDTLESLNQLNICLEQDSLNYSANSTYSTVLAGLGENQKSLHYAQIAYNSAFKECESLTRRAYKRNYSCQESCMNLGYAFFRVEDYNAAINYLSPEKGGFAFNNYAYIFLVIAHQKIGNQEMSCHYYQRLIECLTIESIKEYFPNYKVYECI